MAVRISTDLNALDRKLRARVDKFPRAAAAGINRSARGAYTLAVREIQADTEAGAQKAIRKNLTLKLATADKPEARLTAFSSKKDRIPIIELRPSPRGLTKRRPIGGVRYGRARKLLPSAFIARLKSGHVGVFKRVGKPRLPIVELQGPSVALVFSRKKITDKVKAFLRESVPKEISRALKFGNL